MIPNNIRSDKTDLFCHGCRLELNQQVQSNTAVSTVNIPKLSLSCSGTYKINKEAESRIWQESTPNAKRRSNLARKNTRMQGKSETGLLLETKHMTAWRQRRESLGMRLSTWSIKITSVALNNFAPEKLFGGPNSCWWMLQNSQMRPHYEGILCWTQYIELSWPICSAKYWN